MYLSILFATIFLLLLLLNIILISQPPMDECKRDEGCPCLLTPSSWLLIFLGIKRFKFPLKYLFAINCLILHAFVCQAFPSSASAQHDRG